MASEAEARDGIWSAVRLTEARQVAALMGHHRDDWPATGIDVERHFASLRRSGSTSAAIDYLAHALPRLESVAWAVRVVERFARPAPSATTRQAIDCAIRWLGERTDVHRRAAVAAAEAIGRPVAERFVGQAVFYSGGSIADLDQPPLWPPQEAAARYVSAAIGAAVERADDPAVTATRALDLGEAVARQGLAALELGTTP